MSREEIDYTKFLSYFIPEKSPEVRNQEIIARRIILREADHKLFVKAQQYRKNLKSGKYISPRRRKLLEELKKEKDSNPEFISRVRR